MTEKDANLAHDLNMMDLPWSNLPFYQWLKELQKQGELKTTARTFPQAIFAYYAPLDLRGRFTREQLNTYENIYRQVWWELQGPRKDPGPGTGNTPPQAGGRVVYSRHARNS